MQGFAAGCVRAVCLGSAWAALAVASPAAAADALRIVILPMVVHSGASESGYVSRGIADMISSRLEQDPELRALPIEDTRLATTSLSQALEQGRERGADFVLFGAFTQFGDGASLDLHCVPALANEVEAEAARRIFIQSGAVGEIIPRLDEIVDRVAVYVRAQAGRAIAPPPGSDAGPGRRPANEAAALRELAERVRALEAQVYGGAEKSAAALDAEAAPGS